MARENLKRAEAGRRPVTLRGLAREAGLTLSALSAFAAGQTRRVDFETLDKLCSYFQIGVGDLLVWEPGEGSPQERPSQAAE